MSSSLPIVPPRPEGPGPDGRSSSGHTPRRQPAPAQEPEPEQPSQSHADPGQRLIIEETEGGGLVYTVIDRASGAVVARTSRQELSEMGQRPGYSAGDLIRTSA